MQKSQTWRLSILAAFVLAFTTTSNSAQAQTYSVVYNLGSHAAAPVGPFYSGIISQGRDGNLYGSTPSGGEFFGGVAYKITPAGALTKLHDFGPEDDGVEPWSGLKLSTDGQLYGTTRSAPGSR